MEKKKYDDKKQKDQSSLSDGIDVLVNQETEQIYSEAARQHVVAYEGIDYAQGKRLERGLEKISRSKVNSQYRDMNIKQQAGFSAEVKEVARNNAEQIVKRKENRLIRTDDLGRVNDPLYDFQVLDGSGNVIKGSGSQMKFVGKNSRECLNKLMSSKFQKYRDHDVAFVIPSDYYDGVNEEIDKDIRRLRMQQRQAENQGNQDLAVHKKEKIDELVKVKKRLKKSKVSNEDALKARMSPRLSTAEDIHDLSMQAGTAYVEHALPMDVAISGTANIIAVCQNKKSVEEAMKDFTLTLGKKEACNYLSGYSQTTIMAFMKNSQSSLVRSLGQTNLPAATVQTLLNSADAFYDLICGRISGAAFMQRVGKNGLTTASTMAYGTVGQLLIPIPVAGMMVGCMIGCVLSSMSYGCMTQALKEARLAKEERIQVEHACQENIEAIQNYRQMLDGLFEQDMFDLKSTYDAAFSEIKKAFQTGNADTFISGVNTITRKNKGHVAFDSVKEFDDFMKSDTSLDF